MARTTDGDGTPVPQRLLAAATRLFADRGYDRTSVQEIVEAAGVTKGALYHYFGSKDDLLHEVYARMLRVQQERLDAFADADAPVDFPAHRHETGPGHDAVIGDQQSYLSHV
ncbi:helix-turn-helix domain-containing protein, partial [Streptomyces spectabilis]|uniref:helix-turn-helix domain-containing protein n=1 Tax=Streptomyces spectabilis TaxID=68270 RepID=UPI0033FCC496